MNQIGITDNDRLLPRRAAKKRDRLPRLNDLQQARLIVKRLTIIASVFPRSPRLPGLRRPELRLEADAIGPVAGG
jgi:hypothetical protein